MGQYQHPNDPQYQESDYQPTSARRSGLEGLLQGLGIGAGIISTPFLIAGGVILIVVVLCGACCLCGVIQGALSPSSTFATPRSRSTREPAQPVGFATPVQTEESLPPVEPDPPTATPEPEGLVKTGVHLVGSDIQPGVYVRQAGEQCYWARLSGLTGDLDSIIANENSEGQIYIEVQPSDVALETGCDLLPLEQVPPPSELLTTLPAGMYLVGRDIGPGVYSGQAEGGQCYWARLSNLAGDLDGIIANDNAQGQFFIEVLPDDFAIVVGCEVVAR